MLLLVEAFDKMTVKEPVKTSWGSTTIPVKLNKKGIMEVLTQLAKKLKASLE